MLVMLEAICTIQINLFLIREQHRPVSYVTCLAHLRLSALFGVEEGGVDIEDIDGFEILSLGDAA